MTENKDVRRLKPGLWLVVMVIALAGFLPLAWLQYRWTGEISVAERERRERDLRLSLSRFAQEFDGEIRHIERSLFFGPEVRAADLSVWENRYAALAASEVEPHLIKAFLVTKGEETYRWNSASGQLELSKWPADLGRLRERLEELRKEGLRDRTPQTRPEIDELALISPRFDSPPVFAVREPGASRPPISGWAVVLLNQRVLSDVVLPRLAGRYLLRGGGEGYNVRVVSAGNPSNVIYDSDPALPPAFFDKPDGVVQILNLPAVSFIRRLRRPPGPGFEPDRPGPSAERLEERRGFDGPGERPFGPPGERHGMWLVMARHQAGSLEAVVTDTRRRNLAVSLGILLLMAFSLVVLLVATRRAQRLARLQMEFVAGVSHELRTPLSVICSAADNLADGKIGGEEKVRRYGTLIRGEGRRLANMVDQIMRFAGIQSGRVRYEFKPVPPSEIVRRAVGACEEQIRSAGCDVEQEIEPDLPPAAADLVSLVHVLRNLVDNALVHGGGKWMRIEAGLKGGRIVISVLDRGPGLPASEMSRIFEPFQRGRRALEDQLHGFGLGLALARRVVEAHRGTLAAESSPGKGSRFTVSLPVWSENDGTQNTADRG